MSIISLLVCSESVLYPHQSASLCQFIHNYVHVLSVSSPVSLFSKQIINGRISKYVRGGACLSVPLTLAIIDLSRGRQLCSDFQTAYCYSSLSFCICPPPPPPPTHTHTPSPPLHLRLLYDCIRSKMTQLHSLRILLSLR